MAKKKKIDYTDLSREELLERLEDQSKELQRTKFNYAISASTLTDHNVFKKMRRDIARIKTELRARELRNG